MRSFTIVQTVQLPDEVIGAIVAFSPFEDDNQLLDKVGEMLMAHYPDIASPAATRQVAAQLLKDGVVDTRASVARMQIARQLAYRPSSRVRAAMAEASPFVDTLEARLHLRRAIQAEAGAWIPMTLADYCLDGLKIDGTVVIANADTQGDLRSHDATPVDLEDQSA